MKLIKIGAVWCPGCLVMNPRINKIAKENNIELINYDYDLDTEMVNKYQPGNILPVLILLDESDKEIDRLIGESSIEKLKRFIEK